MPETGSSAFLRRAAAGGPFGERPDQTNANVAKINAEAKNLPAEEQLARDLVRSIINREKRTSWGMKIGDSEIELDSASLNKDKPSGEKTIQLLKDTALELARSSENQPENDWLRGIELIAQYHHQSFLAYGTMLPEAYFGTLITATLANDPACYIEKNNTKVITFLYDIEKKEWYYEVDTSISFIDTTHLEKPPTKLSDISYRFRVTEDGFELASIEYKNPIIATILEHHTPFDALRFIGYLVETLPRDIQNQKLLLLLKNQYFPIHQWHAHFLIALKKNITHKLRFSELLKEQSSESVFIEAFKKITPDRDSDLDIAFFTALYQTYAIFPDANTEKLLSQILTPEMQNKMDQPFSITTPNGCQFILYVTGKEKKDLEKLQSSFLRITPPTPTAVAGLFSHSTMAVSLPKKQLDSNQAPLYQKYYDSKKQQLIEVLDHITASDGVLLLDELFLIKDKLQIKDEQLSMVWPTLSEASPHSPKQMQAISLEERCMKNELTQQKQALFPIIRNLLKDRKKHLSENDIEKYNGTFDEIVSSPSRRSSASSPSSPSGKSG